MTNDDSHPIVIDGETETISMFFDRIILVFLISFIVILPLILPILILFLDFISIEYRIVVFIVLEIIFIFFLFKKKYALHLIHLQLKSTPIKTTIFPTNILIEYKRKTIKYSLSDIARIERDKYLNTGKPDQEYFVLIHLNNGKDIYFYDDENWHNYEKIIKWSDYSIKQESIQNYTYDTDKKELIKI